MPSRPFWLAVFVASVFAVAAPAQAKKDPLPTSGTTTIQPTSSDQGKKSPYTDSTGVTTVVAPTPLPNPPSTSGAKRRNTATTNTGKKSPTSGSSNSDSTVTTVAATPPPAPAAPVSTTPVATTPVKQRVSSGSTRKRGSSSGKRKSSSGSSARRTAAARPAATATPTATTNAKRAPAKRTAGKKDKSAAPAASAVTRTVHDIVKVIPAPLKMLLAGMAGLLLAALAGWTTVTLRARRLKRQRRELLAEVGLLQAALLPEVPERLGAVAASVAYRPADGPGAGGDFYDFFEMEDGRIGVVLGDVAGHGREALARTALLRYTLRAYLETGLEPRTALRLGGETLEHNLSS